MVDALSVQETYFWREIGQVHALVNDLLPKYVAQFPDRPIRIWCAAVAHRRGAAYDPHGAGRGRWLTRGNIEIYASDASPAALAKARQAHFRDRSFRALPSALREKYFSQHADGWRINAELFSRITWSRANLVVPAEIAALSRAQFIFCRNVFIYFTEQMIARTIREFAKGMSRPGYLFVGASESLLKLTDDFELEEADGSFVYALKPA